MVLVLVILLVLLLCGGGYAYRGGYVEGPYAGGGFGFVGVLLIVLLVLALTGRL